MLWLDEIQGGIWQSNKDTQEAQRCTYGCFISVSVAAGGRCGGAVSPIPVFQLDREPERGRGQSAMVT